MRALRLCVVQVTYLSLLLTALFGRTRSYSRLSFEQKQTRHLRAAMLLPCQGMRPGLLLGVRNKLPVRWDFI